MKHSAYEQLLQPLHIELLKMQRWLADEGQRLLVIFEGRDAAGKGGVIKRMVKHLNPRGYRVVALNKPTAHEQSQWYFQRYVAHLPAGGEIVFFDRSWYNRAGIERVMGFCTPPQVEEFFQSVTEFERMQVRSGTLLAKFYLSIDRAEQRRRIEVRQQNPLKHWKLTPLDLKSLDHWEDYSAAETEMLGRTATEVAPWVWVDANDKRRSRLNIIRYLLTQLDYPDKDSGVLTLEAGMIRRIPPTGS